MVGGTILPHQTGTVQAEHHRQPQERDVVDDIVVGTLHEAAVDVAEGLQSLLGHTSAEGGGMSLGYAYVEGALRHTLHHDVHRAAGGHGRGHAHNAGVLLSQLHKGVTKDILELGRQLALILLEADAGLRVKAPRSMPWARVLLSRGKALAFAGMKVE